ncbi:MAG: hypothetical protein GY787_31010 [Alteromonadales bacterium]|nr:hypothetical protein [Alteromonadales bacterium]
MRKLNQIDISKIKSILGSGWSSSTEKKVNDTWVYIKNIESEECIKLIENLHSEHLNALTLQTSNSSGSGHQEEVISAYRSNVMACEEVLEKIRSINT